MLKSDKLMSVFMSFCFFRPRELDFKYVMKVSSLKESLPEAAFRRRNYLEQKGLLKCNSTFHILVFLRLLSTLVVHTFTYMSKFHLKYFLKWPFEEVEELPCCPFLGSQLQTGRFIKMTRTLSLIQNA